MACKYNKINGVLSSPNNSVTMNNKAIIKHIQSRVRGKPHTCTKACCTRPINVHVHENDGFHIRWSGNNQPWMNKDTFRRSLQYVFICTSTNTIHHCTENCSLEPIPNDDHTLVCPVSGVQWNNETETVRSWKLTSKCVPTITSDKRDPNMYSRDKHGQVTADTLNIKDESCKRQVKKFLKMLVCSHRRICQELDKHRQGKVSGLKQANKYIKHCKANKKFLNAATLQNILLTETFQKPVFLRNMALYEDKIDTITDEIYPVIISVWKQVDVPRQIAFELFVPAMLYILQRGVYVDSEEIIKSVPCLNTILPDANTLNDFDIPKSSFTQTKNTIRSCIRKILQKYTINEAKQLLT